MKMDDKLSEIFELEPMEVKKIAPRSTDIVVSDEPVDKHIENDCPKKIEIHYYDGIIITPFGIDLKPEHGSSKTLVCFNKHFKL